MQLWTITANATESSPTECDQVLGKCDKALKACDTALQAKKTEVTICNLGLAQVLESNANLSEELTRSQEKLSSPLRNPFIVGAAGVLLGIIVSGAIRK